MPVGTSLPQGSLWFILGTLCVAFHGIASELPLHVLGEPAGQCFNFDSAVMAHEGHAIRAMTYNHNENWLITGA